VLAKQNLQNSWAKKCAVSREILGENSLLREATPDLRGDRSRYDLMLYQGKLGLRGPKKSNDAWDFDFHPGVPSDIQNLLKPSLLEFVQEFDQELSQISPFMNAAQLRFRCDSKGKYGVWIDTERRDLEKFSESAECEKMKALFHLELGQRGDLIPRSQHSWLPSFSKDNEEIPVECFISSFTQPGPEANRALIACGMEMLDEVAASCLSWSEVGAGYGNLTAAYSTLLGAPEWILEKEARDSSLWEANKKYFIGAKFFPKAVETISEEFLLDLLIADPPRSGFADFFKKDHVKAKHILLYNCDLRGLISDSQALKSKYDLQKWSLIELFPGTPYAETITLWKRR